MNSYIPYIYENLNEAYECYDLKKNMGREVIFSSGVDKFSLPDKSSDNELRLIDFAVT